MDLMPKSPFQIAGDALSSILCERLNEEFLKWQAANGNASQEVFGKRYFSSLGDPQKKISNIIRGKQGLDMADYFTFCRAVGKEPVTLLATALDKLPDRLKKTNPESNHAQDGAKQAV